jgi:hypothetical protein
MLDFYARKVNSFFIKLGGKDRSFKLKTKTVTFATLDFEVEYPLYYI